MEINITKEEFKFLNHLITIAGDTIIEDMLNSGSDEEIKAYMKEYKLLLDLNEKLCNQEE